MNKLQQMEKSDKSQSTEKVAGSKGKIRREQIIDAAKQTLIGAVQTA